MGSTRARYDAERDIFLAADGQIVVWAEEGSISLKLKEAHKDPLELADEEAVDLANILLGLAGDPRHIPDR